MVIAVSVITLQHSEACAFAISLSDLENSCKNSATEKNNTTVKATIESEDFEFYDFDNSKISDAATEKPLTLEEVQKVNQSWYYLSAASLGLSCLQFAFAIIFIIFWHVVRSSPPFYYLLVPPVTDYKQSVVHFQFFQRNSWLRTGINIILLLGIATCSCVSLVLVHPDNAGDDTYFHKVMLAFTTLLCLNMIVMSLSSCCSLQYTLSKPFSFHCVCDWEDMKTWQGFIGNSRTNNPQNTNKSRESKHSIMQMRKSRYGNSRTSKEGFLNDMPREKRESKESAYQDNERPLI